MIGVVARKEFREIVRDGRFRWLAVTCVLLMLFATAGGVQLTTQQLRDQVAATAAERENFEGQGAKNPHAAAHFGQYAFRPVLLPAAIDPGVSPFMGSMIWLEAHRMNLPDFRPAEDNADFGRVARLSVAWVLQFVVPLFVIVVTFAAVAGERERGTLGLALSQGLGLGTLLLGKAAAAVGALFAVLLPLLLVSVAVFSLVIADDHGSAGARLLIMGLAYLVYLLSFAGLSLLVSLLAGSRRNAFFVLTAIWLLFTVALPRIAADVAAVVHPTPSASTFFAGISSGEGNRSGLAADPGARVAEIRSRVQAELLAEYGVESINALPVNFSAVFLQRLEEEDAPIFDFHFRRLWQTYEAQRRVQQWVSLVSPAIAIRQLSMAMAGTDPYAQRHFSVAAENYRREFVGRLNGIQAVDGAGKRFFVAPGDTWATVQDFHYEGPSVSEVLARHRLDLLVLFLWLILPFALALHFARGRKPIAGNGR